MLWFKSARDKLHDLILTDNDDWYAYRKLILKIKEGLTGTDLKFAYDNKKFIALGTLISENWSKFPQGYKLPQEYVDALFDNNIWGILASIIDDDDTPFGTLTPEQMTRLVAAGSQTHGATELLYNAFLHHDPTTEMMAAAEEATDWQMLATACENGYKLGAANLTMLENTAWEDGDNAQWSIIETLAYDGHVFPTARLQDFLLYRAAWQGNYTTAIYMLRAGTVPTPVMPLLVNTELSGGIEAKLLMLKLLRGDEIPHWLTDGSDLPPVLNALFIGNYDSALDDAEKQDAVLDPDYLHVIPPINDESRALINLLAEKYLPQAAY